MVSRLRICFPRVVKGVSERCSFRIFTFQGHESLVNIGDPVSCDMKYCTTSSGLLYFSCNVVSWDGIAQVLSARQVPAEEGTPMREVGAVLMTPSGFLSAIREGKLPDPCQPSKLLLDPHSDEDSSEEGQPNKTAKKKRKGSASPFFIGLFTRWYSRQACACPMFSRC